MGSSAKRKKEKKKDFQKPKLRVGKDKPKAANATDTNFRARAVHLTKQSLTTNAPTVVAQCAHHLGLLNHKASSQRKESLAFLTTAIAAVPPGAPLPQPSSVIIPAVQRLVLDGSNGVRVQLLKLLQALPEGDIAAHTDQLLLHTRAGMTHLAMDIRIFALEVLEWLLTVAGDEAVSCAGSWVKMLRCFLALLGWQNNSSGKWSSVKDSNGKIGGDAKTQVKQITALTAFLKTGLVPSQKAAPLVNGGSCFPLWQTEHHIPSERSSAYAHLNLFGSARDEEAEMYEDREDRQRVFHNRAEAPVVAGLDAAIKGGGELGRACAGLRKVVKEGMADYHETAI